MKAFVADIVRDILIDLRYGELKKNIYGNAVIDDHEVCGDIYRSYEELEKFMKEFRDDIVLEIDDKIESEMEYIRKIMNV